MLLAGITWTILARRVPAGNFSRLLAFGIIAVMISGQIFTMPFWQKGYLHMSRKALNCYQAGEVFGKRRIAPSQSATSLRSKSGQRHTTIPQK